MTKQAKKKREHFEAQQRARARQLAAETAAESQAAMEAAMAAAPTHVRRVCVFMVCFEMASETNC